MCMLYEISWAIAMCILPFFSLLKGLPNQLSLQRIMRGLHEVQSKEARGSSHALFCLLCLGLNTWRDLSVAN